MHVLSLPPAFVLSQDQTLKFEADMSDAMHIDEDTHQIQKSEDKRKKSVPQEKRAPIKQSPCVQPSLAKPQKQSPPATFPFPFITYNVKQLTPFGSVEILLSLKGANGFVPILI